jgi:uncharacterized protein
MAVVLALMFRVRWRLLPLLSVLIGVLWSFSLLGIIGIDLSLVTISGLPILIGVGIDFAIQVHNRVEEEVVLDKEAHPIAETLANLGPPLIAATVTGVAAFVALRISKVPMIRDFGVLLAIGISVLVVIGIVVTASALGIREYTKRTEVRGASLVERVVVKLGGLPTKFGLPIIVISTVLFVGGVLAEGRAKIESDPLKWIDQDSQVVKDIGQLEDETGFSSTLGILVAANNVYDQDVIDLIWEFTLDAEARDEVVSSSSMVNTMGKIVLIDGATPVSPTSEDIVASVEQMPPAVARALLRGVDDPTATQLNLRLAPSSLDERAVFVRELEADLQARIEALDLPADSILLSGLPEGQEPVRATPAGLATVGIGLLENLSANRANLTYLALALAGLWLVLRFRSLTRALLALVPVLLAVGVSSLVVGLLGFTLSPLTTVSGPLVIASCAEFSVLILGRYLEERQRGLSPRAATDTAASRTGRAFFTSAVTTICGFAVLIGSSLPLLRDFGLIVTLNISDRPPGGARRDAAAVGVGRRTRVARHAASGCRTARFGASRCSHARSADRGRSGRSGGLRRGGGCGLCHRRHHDGTSERDRVRRCGVADHDHHHDGAADDGAGRHGARGTALDPNDFGSDRPVDPVSGILFDTLTAQGVPPNQANCAIESVPGGIASVDTGAVLAGDDAAAAPVIQAALALRHRSGHDRRHAGRPPRGLSVPTPATAGPPAARRPTARRPRASSVPGAPASRWRSG